MSSPQNKKYEYDVFISHASEDNEWCEKLASQLKDAGLRIWFDRWNDGSDKSLVDMLSKGLKKSRRFVPVMTKVYFNKVWTQRELNYAIIEDTRIPGRFVIPILREDCSFPPFLEDIPWIDFTNDADFENNCVTLIRTLRETSVARQSRLKPHKAMRPQGGESADPGAESNAPKLSPSGHSFAPAVERPDEPTPPKQDSPSPTKSTQKSEVPIPENLVQSVLEHSKPEQSTTISKADSAIKDRRIDAATPSQAVVGEYIDLLVQVRFPDSPLLGRENWHSRKIPQKIEQISENVVLQFPVDPRTGKLASASLEIKLVAPDFEIAGEARQRLLVPIEEYSKCLSFLITPKKPGVCRINVEVYDVEQNFLGAIPLETNIGGAFSMQNLNIANLLLFVAVGQMHQPAKVLKQINLEKKICFHPLARRENGRFFLVFSVFL